MTRAGRLGRAAAVLVAAGGLVLAVAAPASAHNYLVGSTPEAGQTLTQLPERFVIKTNDVLLEVSGTDGFALQVRDAAGRYYGDGCLTVSGDDMSAPAALGAPGAYTVLWQVVSADGHTVDGEIPFTWAPAAGQPESPSSATPPVCDTSSASSATTGPGTTVTATATPGTSVEPPAATTSAGAIDPTATGVDRNAEDGGDVLWVLSAAAAVVIAVAVTLLVLLRRKPAAD